MTLTGVHHVALTVRDVEATATWWEQALGFQRAADLTESDRALRKVILARPGLAVRVSLVQHLGSDPGTFDEHVAGLDHVAFAVESVEELARWADHLAASGIPCSPLISSTALPGARLVVLRDPNNIQVELYADPD